MFVGVDNAVVPGIRIVFAVTPVNVYGINAFCECAGINTPLEIIVFDMNSECRANEWHRRSDEADFLCDDVHVCVPFVLEIEAYNGSSCAK